jgi:hypothetical protein
LHSRQYPDDSALYDALQAAVAVFEDDLGWCSCPEAEREWNIQDGDSEELCEDMPDLVPVNDWK